MDVDSEERSDIFLYLYSRGGGLEGERSARIALHRGLADGHSGQGCKEATVKLSKSFGDPN